MGVRERRRVGVGERKGERNERVCVRKREREGGREKERERERKVDSECWGLCAEKDRLCETERRERERERERERVEEGGESES